MMGRSMSDLQRELDQCQRLKTAIFEASSDGLAILDANGRFIDVNRAWERIMGMTRAEVLGRTDLEMYRAVGYEGPMMWKKIGPDFSPAAVLMKINGDTVLVAATTDRGPGGAIQHVIVTARNLTQLNDLRQQLEQHGIGDYRKIEEFHAAQLKSMVQAAGLGEMVVAGSAIRNSVMLAAQAARFDATVLLYGETGTGKGLFSKLIHRLSARAAKPFIEVNCGAIPETLVESELFGYLAGAFTGSLRSGKKGQIELASGGTLFLDEISELPLPSQVKLLKFLDDKVIFPLGGQSPRTVDVRVIAATNTDLRNLVRAGRFREDLFYRLEVIPISILPLRERRDEIRPLVEWFLGRFNQEFGEERTIAPQALSVMASYGYPGNVRELRNLIARLVVSAKGREIGVDDLPETIREAAATGLGIGVEPANRGNGELRSAAAMNLKASFADSERDLLARYAKTCRSAREIARLTGLHHTTVLRKLRKYRIRLAPDPAS
jgi:PAS domain S-box-containing protein